MMFVSSRCTQCPVAPSGPYTAVKAEALAHEQVFAGHQVQIVSGLSLWPRALWTDRPEPVLAPVMEVAA